MANIYIHVLINTFMILKLWTAYFLSMAFLCFLPVLTLINRFFFLTSQFDMFYTFFCPPLSYRISKRHSLYIYYNNYVMTFLNIA